MKTALVTGTSKGIGLEFAKQYAALGWRVVATYRGSPTEALERLNQSAENVNLIDVNIANLNEIDQVAEALGETQIDALISNAGMMGRGGGPEAQVGEHIGTLDYDLFDEYMAINVRAPAKLIEALLGNLKRSENGKAIVISSGAGSFGMPATLPGNYWYKASKAALNMVMRNVANDLRPAGVTVLMFHPGLVLTERLAPMREKILKMSGQEKPFETVEAVANMIATIDRAGLEDSGRFVRNDGSEMPW